MHEAKIKYKCHRCHHIYSPSLSPQCPKCGSLDLILDIEVETPVSAKNILYINWKLNSPTKET